MQFSTTQQAQIKQQNWWEKFISQAHQLFFSSAIFFAIFIMVLSLGILENFLNLDFSTIHGFGLNYAVFTNAFLGFLITVIPKYNSRPAFTIKQYLAPWIIYQLAILVTLFISTIIGKIIVSLTLVYFVKLFFDTIKNSQVDSKQDSIYINYILAIGSLLPLVEIIFSKDLSVLTFFSFVVAMVLIVALKMVTAFHFVYTRISPWKKPTYVRPVSLFLIISTGICVQFDFILALQIISFLSSVFFGYIIFKLNFSLKTAPILSILVLGVYWFEVAYSSLFLESLFLNIQATFKLSFHIFALGFLTTLLIGFASRVTKGHAVPPQAIDSDKFTNFIFIFIQIVLLCRIIASLSFTSQSSLAFDILNLSSILWIVLFILWAIKYGKTLLRID